MNRITPFSMFGLKTYFLLFISIMTLLFTGVYFLAAKSNSPPDLNSLNLPEVSAYTRSSPWGVAPSHTSAWNVDRWKDALYDLRITNVRGFRVDRPDIVERLRETGFELDGILQWSSSASPGSVPVDDLDGWETYIRKTLRKFPYVTHWEVWNEPPNFTSDKTPASYAAIVARAYDVVKSVDPRLKVGLAAKSTHLNYMAQTIASGARDKFDYITLHPYEVLHLVRSGHDVLYMNIAREVRKMLREFNSEKASVPIRFTEIGTELDARLSEGDAQCVQAGVLIKAMVMSVAQGIEKVHWFEPLDAEGLAMGLLQNPETPRKALIAYGNLVELLGRQPVYLGWYRPQRDVVQYFFRNRDQVISISWAERGTDFQLESTDDAVRVIDLVSGVSRNLEGQGIVVSAEPVVATYPLSNTGIRKSLQSAMDNRSKPLLYRGRDFSDAEEISITPSSELGIQLLGKFPIIDNGSEPAFDISQEGALTLILDSSFFNRFAEDVELTIELRAKSDASHRPGFNLQLDSYTGAEIVAGENAHAGWNGITETEFYRKSWAIYGLTSTGSFGYQVRFESDSTELSQYEVRRLSVKRLSRSR